MELYAAIIGVVSAVVSGIFGAIQLRAKQSLERAKQVTDIELAEINARLSSEETTKQALTLFSDLSTNIQANTKVLTAVAERLLNTESMVDGFRRENQVHMATEKERHDLIVAALEPLPRIDANVSEIKTTWPQDFRRVGESLAHLKAQNEAQGNALALLHKDWQTTGTRILMFIENQTAADECDDPDPDPPLSPNTKPLPGQGANDNNDQDAAQQDAA